MHLREKNRGFSFCTKKAVRANIIWHFSTVTFQGSMSKISNSAFEGCKLLKNITVERKASSTGMKLIQLGECAFKDCTGLESAEFTGNFVTDKKY